MGFAHTGMLWFGLAAAVPLIIHLLNRQRYRRMRWAAMEFLLAALKKTRRRVQLENLLLLLIRMMLMALLALALSRPFVRVGASNPLSSPQTHLIIVLDNSYSMGYRTAGRPVPFDKAKSFAGALLNSLKPEQGDRASLILMSDRPSALIAEPVMKTDRVAEMIKGLDPSSYSTSMPRTLGVINDVLKVAEKELVKKIYVITDLQKNAWRTSAEDQKVFKDAMEDLSRREDVEFHVVDVGTGETANCAITSLKPQASVITVDSSVVFDVNVHNYGSTDETNLVLDFYENGQKISSSNVYVPAGRSTMRQLVCDFRETGPQTVKAEIGPESPDPLAADNARFWSAKIKDSIKVLAVNGEPASERFKEELVYFELALRPTQDETDKSWIYYVDKVSDATFETEDLRKYDVVVLANVGTVSEEKKDHLQSFVESGGGLLIFLGDKVIKSSYNDVLYAGGAGLLPGELQDMAGGEDNASKFGKTDFNHPALGYFYPFRDLLGSINTKFFYKVKQEPDRTDIKTLMCYDDPDNSPALMEKTFGRGKVLLFTSSCDDEWNNFPAWQTYVVLMDQVTMYLASQPQAMTNVTVGEPIRLAFKKEEYIPEGCVVKKPGGESVRKGLVPTGEGAAGDSKKGYVLYFPETETVGFYTVEKSAETATPPISCFAVNVLPEEGDLSRTSEAELKRDFPGFVFKYEAGETPSSGKIEIKQPPSRIWKYIAYAVLALLLAEMLLAQVFGTHKK
jgi:uncharacterized membrane protein